MNFQHLTAGEAAGLIEATPENLRDWRRRGFLRGYGELQSDGKWRYSLKDALCMAIAKNMGRKGVDLEAALKAARIVATPVSAAVLGEEFDRHVVAVRRSESGSGEINITFGPSIESLGAEVDKDPSIQMAIFIRMANIVEELPPRILELVRQDAGAA